jgi:type III secretion protein J
MKKKLFNKKHLKYFFFLSVFLLIGCSENQSIVTNIDERDANEIIVFLASKGIESQKIQAESGAVGGQSATTLWNIIVDKENSVNAMAILNQNGLPRKHGTSILELFAKSGLMTSDREEKIRYQAGLEEELTNTIRKIDGVLDANVQISFPSEESIPGIGPKQKIKAAVYVKHQGLLDDPNNHMESKIKRLISGSVEDLNFENVSVIMDQSKFADIRLSAQGEPISNKLREKEYISIWSIIMTKTSAGKFRFIFFTLIILVLVFGGVIGFGIYKFYPQMQKNKKKKSPPPKSEAEE